MNLKNFNNKERLIIVSLEEYRELIKHGLARMKNGKYYHQGARLVLAQKLK